MAASTTIVLREFGSSPPPLDLGQFRDTCVDPGASWSGAGVTSSTNLLLVFGDKIYYTMPANVRIVQLPSLLDPRWNQKTFSTAGRFVREGTVDTELFFSSGRLLARNIIPF